MYERIKASELPKQDHQIETKFEKTPEWAAMKEDLEAGLPEVGAGGLQVRLTPEELTGYGIRNAQTVTRFLKKYLAGRDSKLIVRTLNKDGRWHFIVVHPKLRSEAPERPHKRAKRSSVKTKS